MAIAKYSNNAQSVLAGSISDSQTTITLQAGGGAEFPTLTSGEQFTATLTDAATGLLREIVVCTARTGDTLTVVRGQEGTTPLAWAANDLFAQLSTAGQMAALVQAAQAQAQEFNYAVDVGSANAYQVILDPSVNTPVNGMPIRVLIGNTNTGASTLDFGAGAVAIERRDGSALIGNELVQNQIAEFIYNSANNSVQLMQPAPATTAAISAGTDTQSMLTPSFIPAIQAQTPSYAVDTGAANTYVATMTPPVNSLINGAVYRIKIANNNTGASTLNVGAGAIAIERRDGSALIGGELIAGEIAEFVYNPTTASYQLLSPTPATNAATAAQTDNQSYLTPLNLQQAFPFSFGASGNITLPGPSGIRFIIEWGQTVVNSGTQAPVLFSVPMTGGLLSLQVTCDFDTSGLTGGWAGTGGGTAGFTLRNDTNKNGNFSWLAVGRV